VFAPVIAQVEEPDGFALPDDAGTALIWAVFFAVVTGLWVVLGRTRRRAEEDRRRRIEERDERERPPLE
jgi:cytochrome c-type biogenesis protein CcmH/NrfF